MRHSDISAVCVCCVQVCLICIPWMKLSVSQAALVDLSLASIIGLLICGLVIHLIYLAFNYLCATYLLRSPLAIKKSLVIMGSQKTLPMAMTILSFFPESLGQQQQQQRRPPPPHHHHQRLSLSHDLSLPFPQARAASSRYLASSPT